ncbi:MAG: SpoIIE family protein phosphatase [Gaiellaceae bacterium]
MVVESNQREHGRAAALDALASAGVGVAEGANLTEALGLVAHAAARAAGADVVLVRVLERAGGSLSARAVAAAAAVAAELEGTRLAPGELPEALLEDLTLAPDVVRRAAERVGARSLLLVPVILGGQPLASVELLRGRPFDGEERRSGLLAGAQVALVLRAFGVDGAPVASPGSGTALELAGQALAAGSDGERTAEEVTRLAAEVTGAVGALLWEGQPDDELVLAAMHGLSDGAPDLAATRALALRAAAEGRSVERVRHATLPQGAAVAVALPLGQPPIGILQLLFADGATPSEPELAALGTFAVRAARSLRAGVQSRRLAQELERTRALLAVVGQATAQLSLVHTLETAVERVAELLGVDQLAVYLLEGDRLVAAAGRGLAGPHVRVAERLLALALGPLRGRGVIALEGGGREPLLHGVEEAAAEAGLEAALAVPLVAQEQTIGLLAVYPRRGRRISEHDRSLLAALAGQLAVAVQNAQLHEQATKLGQHLESALASERQAAKRLGALYEISRSFAQSLSLDATLEAVTTTVVEVLDVDAAVIRMPDERREQLVVRALHVADPNLAGAARVILDRPQPFGARPVQRLFRRALPFRLDRRRDDELGVMLGPFLELGWTSAVVPVSIPGEVIASLSLLSVRPGAPITDETIEAAMAIAGQAALAIDNARLYQQQKEFSDAMQRALLPRSEPEVPGLEVGQVYESSARMDVGGDVYDFLELADGRLAVVLGDVTGHGIEATADMAMAKFVFRSLAREHPEPGDFLAAANDVVSEEIAPGKFITMAYVTIDAARGEVACSAAGHPPPRLVLPDGTVESLDTIGLVLGVDAGQTYQEVRAQLPVGAAVLLYTDGVIEARRNGELYGTERLDELLAARSARSAKEIALAVVQDCRSFAGGELTDDCAVVVIKRTE